MSNKKEDEKRKQNYDIRNVSKRIEKTGKRRKHGTINETFLRSRLGKLKKTHVNIKYIRIGRYF